MLRELKALDFHIHKWVDLSKATSHHIELNPSPHGSYHNVQSLAYHISSSRTPCHIHCMRFISVLLGVENSNIHALSFMQCKWWKLLTIMIKYFCIGGHTWTTSMQDTTKYNCSPLHGYGKPSKTCPYLGLICICFLLCCQGLCMLDI